MKGENVVILSETLTSTPSESFPVLRGLMLNTFEPILARKPLSLLNDTPKYPSGVHEYFIYSADAPLGPCDRYCCCQIADAVSITCFPRFASIVTRGVLETWPKGAPVSRLRTWGWSAAIGCHAWPIFNATAAFASPDIGRSFHPMVT